MCNAKCILSVTIASSYVSLSISWCIFLSWLVINSFYAISQADKAQRHTQSVSVLHALEKDNNMTRLPTIWLEMVEQPPINRRNAMILNLSFNPEADEPTTHRNNTHSLHYYLIDCYYFIKIRFSVVNISVSIFFCVYIIDAKINQCLTSLERLWNRESSGRRIRHFGNIRLHQIISSNY